MTRVILFLVFMALAGTASAEDRIYCEKGQEAFDARNFELAIANFNGCILWGDLTPENKAIAYYHRGGTYYHWGQLDHAIEDYDRALQLDPDFPDVFNDRGWIYVRTGKFDQAIADFDRAIELKPDYALAFVNRAAAYMGKGQFDQAIDDSDQAIRLEPDNAKAFNTRGVLYLNTGEFDRAIQDLDQALRLNPDYADAFQNKVLAMNGKAWKLATSSSANERDGAAAVRLAREAIGLIDAPAIRDTLAAAYAEAGQFDDAVAEQQRTIEMLRVAGASEAVIAAFQARLELYRNRQPVRE